MASCVMQPANPNESAELAKVCQQVAERSSRILADFAQKQTQSMSAAMRDEMGIAKAFMDLYSRMAADPALVASVTMNLWIDQVRLWQSNWMKLFGMDSQPVAEPAKGDYRFKDEDWSKNFLFDYIKQSYLIAARHTQQAVASVEGLSPESEKKVAFFTRQYMDALSPSNFLMTNPQVLRETLASGGQNLVRGLNNLLADIEKGGGELRISMTDETAFQLGRNVATSPGKVVYQTDLMQLIQYQPSTTQVYRRPLVIIPPWINKYYILDLREKNSFIRWAVEQGHTVFVVSWVNPGAALGGKGFDDYMTEGSLAAIDAVQKATGEREINVIGYCLGGTLLGATLGYMAAKKDERVKSATFFVSLLDFSQPGELGVFIDEAQVASLEKKMNERGYLEGSEMASTFNMLRSNDLVWSFVVNNYLMGKDPFPFDLLYWNADSTRMPARMHSYYLRNMYIKNLMGVPGGLELAGERIDLSKVKLPSYFISTVEDHIAPWKTTYKGARYLGGPVRFVLGGSGHIAGIVNPPSAKKYQYWTNDASAATADEWFAGAKQHAGSWWEDWQRWMNERNGGEKVPARIPANAIEDAPGSYASLRLQR
ncbi:MAG TPA: class I poly(R)-hydroxyalkanoic acid synthase [Burkholderiales bacterium]|nr:class I poly(R)-hydroxyalkanoic acid synthase [Burkholderiales bacterium]